MSMRVLARCALSGEKQNTCPSASAIIEPGKADASSLSGVLLVERARRRHVHTPVTLRRRELGDPDQHRHGCKPVTAARRVARVR
jgi:hypothetical protein